MVDSTFDARSFRDALGSFATGVTVMTTVDAQGHDVGLTANSFNSVSLDPPMILWSLARASRNLPAFKQADHFAVHILSSQQQSLSNRFATSKADKFAGLDLSRGDGGVPLIDGCAARFVCRTAHQYDGGDHVIFVGEVLEFTQAGSAPLIYHGGDYVLAARIADALSADGMSTEDYSFDQDFVGHLLGRARFQIYQDVRVVLDHHKLSEADHVLLSALSARDGWAEADMDDLIEAAAATEGTAEIDRLVYRGMIERRGDALWITGAAREALKELSDAAKSVEAHVADSMTAHELLALKNRLRNLIHATSAEG